MPKPNRQTDTPDSGFHAEADSAAERMKAQMGLPISKVPASAAGSYKEPPKGSYIAQAIEEQRRKSAQRETEIEQPVEAPLDNQQETDATEVDPDVERGREPSMRAQERIRQLAREKKDLERKYAEKAAEAEQKSKEAEDLRGFNHQLADRFRRIQETQFENLSPDERAEVLAEVKAQETAQRIKDEVMREVRPSLQQAAEARFSTAMSAIARRYPLFDAEVHPELIRQQMGTNQNLSPEQAWRLVASEEELFSAASRSTRPSSSGAASVIPPRSTQGSKGATSPPPNERESEHDKLARERNEWIKLSKSTHPDDRRAAERLLHENLKKRLGG